MGVPVVDTDNGPDVSSPTYSTKSAGSIAVSPQDISFSSNGLNMYVMDGSADAVVWFTLTTAWDVSTLTQQYNVSVATYESAPKGIHIHPTGEKVWFCGTSGDDINEFTLSTPYALASATSPYVTSTIGNLSCLHFDVTGTHVYTGSGEVAYELSLSTAWDLSTYTLEHTTTGVFDTAKDTDITGIFINDAGTKLYIIDNKDDDIRQYTLSTPFDLSSKSATADVTVDLSTNSRDPSGLFFNANDSTATKMFIADDSGNDVDVYTIP
tara:strand:- start:2478 stop:3278 length:801 start_codon:yes stop_codon:yes gene_type:complete